MRKRGTSCRSGADRAKESMLCSDLATVAPGDRLPAITLGVSVNLYPCREMLGSREGFNGNYLDKKPI